MNRQELLHIDATPDDKYPLRILQAYRSLGNARFATSTSGGEETNQLIIAMNEMQDRRNELLDKAIRILSEVS